MLNTENPLFRVCANLLRADGYTIFAGAVSVPAVGDKNTPTQPDIVALHPDKRALRVYLCRNQGSHISSDVVGVGERVVHAQGYEDLQCLITTGRPHVKNPQGGFF